MSKSAKKSYALRRSAKRSARRSVKRSTKRSAKRSAKRSSRRNKLKRSIKSAVKQYFTLHGGGPNENTTPSLTNEDIPNSTTDYNTEQRNNIREAIDEFNKIYNDISQDTIAELPGSQKMPV